MYTFGKIDFKGVFVMDREKVLSGQWSMLPTAAKSILPVLCYHRNKKTGIAFPSEQTIAIMAGITEKTVRAGLKALVDDDWMKVTRFKTKYGNISNEYCIKINQDRGQYILLRKSIIEGGNWYNLKPTARALYIALLCNGEFEYQNSNSEEYDYDDNDNAYASREWEFCHKSIYDMARMAGISTDSIESALKSLKHCELIKKEQDSLQVFITPKMNFKQEYMNNKIKKSYGYLIKKRETKGLAKFHLPDMANNDLTNSKEIQVTTPCTNSTGFNIQY